MRINDAATLAPGTVVLLRGMPHTPPQRAVVREVIGMTSPRVVVRLRSGVEKVALARELYTITDSAS